MTDLARAMERLFRANKIWLEPHGPRSKGANRLAIKEGPMTEKAYRTCAKCGAALSDDGIYEQRTTRNAQIPLTADDPEMINGWQCIPLPPEWDPDRDLGWKMDPTYDSDRKTQWRRPRCRVG